MNQLCWYEFCTHLVQKLSISIYIKKLSDWNHSCSPIQMYLQGQDRRGNCDWLIGWSVPEALQRTDRQTEDWLESGPGTHSAPWPFVVSLCWVSEHSGSLHPPERPSLSGGGQALQGETATVGVVRGVNVCRVGVSTHEERHVAKRSRSLLGLEVTLPVCRLLGGTCSASSLLMARASWSCRSSSPELCGQAWSGSPPPECEPADRLPPRLGAEGAEEAGVNINVQQYNRELKVVLWQTLASRLTTGGLGHLLFGFEGVDPLLP